MQNKVNFGRSHKKNNRPNPIVIARRTARWMENVQGFYRLYRPEIDGSYNDVQAHRVRNVSELKRKPSLAVYIDPDGTIFKEGKAKREFVFTRKGHKPFDTMSAQVTTVENPSELSVYQMAMNTVLAFYPKTFGKKRRPKVAIYAKYPLAAAVLLTMECPHIDFYFASSKAEVKRSAEVDEVVANFCLVRKYCRLYGGLGKVLGDKLDSYWPVPDWVAAKYSRRLDENTAEVLQLTGALLRLAQEKRERELELEKK